MMSEIAKIYILKEADIYNARTILRLVAETFYFGNIDQVRIATACSELARNIYERAGRGTIAIEFVSFSGQRGVKVVAQDKRPDINNTGQSNLQNYASNSAFDVGINGAKAVMDEFEINSDEMNGTTISMIKWLPRQIDFSELELTELKNEILEKLKPSDEVLLKELEFQNKELIQVLQQLKESKSNLEILNIELVETNKNVVALHKEAEIKNEKLKDLITTKDKLLSIIGHDIRGPVSTILGLSELLNKNLSKNDTAKSEKYIKYITSSAKSTLSLLENLLAWAKQTGQLDFKPEFLSLKPFIKEVIQELTPTATIKDISINYEQSEEVEVYADKNMLNVIINNLISNAIKFTPNEGKIDVHSKKLLNQVEIIISDNGVGMSEEIKDKLFKIKTNITSRGTANEKGSGLGLILCKEFVEKQGGKIWVESEVDKGSSFHFTIPLNNSILSQI